MDTNQSFFTLSISTEDIYKNCLTISFDIVGQTLVTNFMSVAAVIPSEMPASVCGKHSRAWT